MILSETGLVGLDIGGTKIEAILWVRGRVARSKIISTPKNRKAFLVAISRLVREIGGREGVRAIGIGIAGAIDLKRGVVVASPNLKFLNKFSLTGYLRKQFRKRVAIDNDTKCFLRGESRFGLARGKKNVVALTLGTGVGGAVLVDGQMLRGQNVTAVELGHVIMGGDWKKFLTVEDLVSSHGFSRFRVVDARNLQDRALHGDKRAQEIFGRIGDYLGAALASFVNIFDPELIILGGGIAKGATFFLPRALKVMKKYSFVSISKLPPVKISKLKHAGALGAIASLIK